MGNETVIGMPSLEEIHFGGIIALTDSARVMLPSDAPYFTASHVKFMHHDYEVTGIFSPGTHPDESLADALIEKVTGEVDSIISLLSQFTALAHENVIEHNLRYEHIDGRYGVMDGTIIKASPKLFSALSVNKNRGVDMDIGIDEYCKAVAMAELAVSLHVLPQKCGMLVMGNTLNDAVEKALQIYDLRDDILRLAKTN
jgi:hypothetical protein